MSPIFIILLCAVSIAGCLNHFTRMDRKKKQNFFLRLSQEGIANDLTFCSQEILQNKVIGIDGIHRKIMVLEKTKNKYNCSVISLDEVYHCELITDRSLLNAGNLKKLETEKSLKAIELQFKFKNQAQAASIKFYDSLVNSKRELALLKAKAEYWSIMLSKMLTNNSQVRVRA